MYTSPVYAVLANIAAALKQKAHITRKYSLCLRCSSTNLTLITSAERLTLAFEVKSTETPFKRIKRPNDFYRPSFPSPNFREQISTYFLCRVYDESFPIIYIVTVFLSFLLFFFFKQIL